MRILLVHNFYQQFGGEDAVALAERKLLEEHDDVLVYSRHNDEIKKYGGAQKARFFADTMYCRRTVKDIREAVRDFRPEVAYVHNIFPLISPSIFDILRRLGVPAVQVMHDFRFLCANGRFYSGENRVCERCKHGNYVAAMRHRCYRNSFVLSSLYSSMLALHRARGVLEKIDGYICLTEFARKTLLEVGVPDHKLYIRSNCIETAAITPRFGDSNYVLYVGSLSSEKGLFTLLQAFEKLPQLKLKVAGTGPAEMMLREIIAAHSIRNVEMLGFRAGQEKMELIRNSMFTVVPSEWYENFPMVMLEAYASGKPIVAARIGALPYIVEDGRSGLLFDVGSPGDLALKIQLLAADPDLRVRMGQHARTLAERQYSFQNTSGHLKDIFSDVIQRSRGTRH